jgi:hypothetical protein
MKAAVLVFLLALVGQGGPTLAETKHWIESEGPSIMRSTEVSRVGVIESSVRDLLLDADQCVLSWTTNNNLKARIPLKDVDTGGFLVESNTFLDSAPTFSLRIKTRASVGATMQGWYRGRQQLVDVLSANVKTQNDGERLANAIRRAAVLCGAPASAF